MSTSDEKPTLNDALDYIESASSLEDLRELNRVCVERIKQVRTIQAVRARRTLKVGNTVRFETGRKRKYPAVLEGKITNIAQKFCTVNCGGYGSWRIPMSDVTVI